MEKAERDNREMKNSKICIGCQETKPIDEFPRNPHTRDKHAGRCKKCTSAKARERYNRGNPKNKVFSEDEKTIFHLGVLKGEGRCNDLEKTINILQATIKALVVILKDADKRDANLPSIE